LNRFTRGDAYPLPDISSVLQRIGRSKVITITDCKAGYWQVPVREEDKWLTAFVGDTGLFEFNRSPFGLKCSGHNFVRAITRILRPVRVLLTPLLMTLLYIQTDGKNIWVIFRDIFSQLRMRVLLSRALTRLQASRLTKVHYENRGSTALHFTHTLSGLTEKRNTTHLSYPQGLCIGPSREAGLSTGT